MNKRRTIEKLSTLTLFIVSILILLGFMPVRLGAFGRVAEDILKKAGADSAAVGEVSVTPWRGVRVRDAAVYKHIGAKEDYRFSVSEVNVDCNLFWMGAILYSSPKTVADPWGGQDIFREAYERPLELAGGVSAWTALSRPIKKIAVRGVDIRFTDRAGNPGLSAKGVSADALRRGEQLDGSVAAGEAVIPGLAIVRNFNVKIRADEDKLELAEGSGHVFGGKINAGLSVSTGEHGSWRISGGSASLRGLDLEGFCAGTGFKPGSLSGKVDFDARIEPGTAAHLDSIIATGKIAISGLSVIDIALQKAPAVTKVSGSLRSLQFFDVASNFHLAKGRVNLTEVIGAGDVLSFRSAGWVGFDGKMYQDFEGEFSKKFVALLPKLVRNSLEPTSEGGGSFKCKITGTFHKPRVDVDRSVYNRAFRNLFK